MKIIISDTTALIILAKTNHQPINKISVELKNILLSKGKDER